jgi:DNA-binding response OmpR family regulator
MALVLVIDDDPVLLKAVSVHLEKEGNRVVVARDAEEGLSLARTGNPDLIILDLTMPGKDGLEVLEDLKQNAATRRMPVVILSGETKRDTVVKCMKLGIADYISKGFKLEIFLKKINAALEYSQIQRNKIAPDEVKSVLVSRQTGKTIITFKNKMDKIQTIEDFKSVASDKFWGMIEQDDLILDFRYLTLMSDEDALLVYDILELIPQRDIYLVGGRHYGVIMLNCDFEENIHSFISYGDLELYIYSDDV